MTEDPYQSPSAQPTPPSDPYQATTPPAGGEPAPYGSAPPAAYAAPPGTGPIGKIRPTGLSILLYFVTLGIYGLFWYYAVHDEMKRHKTGDGLGGVLALVLAFFIGIVMPYITSSEVGDLYERRGQPKPVSGLTGLWVFPGIFIIVGPFIWFAKTNGALNDYWASLGGTR
jgi:hypothetical protein